MRPFAAKGHLAACHFPLQNPVGARVDLGRRRVPDPSLRGGRAELCRAGGPAG